MINFASLFGSFSRGGNSVLSDLLDRPDTSLDQLLDIESFPNQYKSGNNKILEFMKYHKYQALVDYVTVQGPADNQKKGYKFPMVAAQLLSVENSIAMDYFLPQGKIEIEVEYDSTEEIELMVDDNDQQQVDTEPVSNIQSLEQSAQGEQKPSQTTEESSTITSEQTLVSTQNQDAKQEEEEVPKPKKKKIIKQTRPIKKTKKQTQVPLMTQLLSYYEGPVNYTLAGYNCKVLTTLFSKKPALFFKFIFNSDKNYFQLICNHIESKSVGDLVTKILVWQSTQFVEERIKLFDHLIHLMSELKQSHVISNLAGAIYEIIEKTSVYIKSKANISNNAQIIKTFLNIFYRTSEVHKIINNAMSEEENRSAYNCLILHAYLHHTEIETFNSFKLEEVLQTFITKASEKLRNIPNRKALGMGRLKIVEIFSFLIRKQPKTLQDENKTNELSEELLQELFIHSMIANVSDFFSILIKLVESFENNNILHNEVFKIFETILTEPEQNGSSLQQLLLNDDNVLLKFIVSESQKDKKIKDCEKHTRRKGYIGHVINICKFIDEIKENSLLDQKLRKNPEFQEVLKTMVAADIIETNKSLAGYQIKKNPARDIMFQKEDILSAYTQFLTHCPKPQFEPEEKEPKQEETNEVMTIEPTQQEKKHKAEENAQKQLEEEQNDEQKFNEVIAIASQQTIDPSDPKFWITHIKYDVDKLMQDVQ